MGQDSYARAIPKWVEQNRLPPLPSSSESSSTNNICKEMYNRGTLWKLGREKRLPYGTWAVDLEQHATVEVCKEIDNNLALEEKKKEEDTFTPQHGVDALTKAIGKLDHRGHVKVTGVGIQKGFGKRINKGPHGMTMGVSMEEVQRLIDKNTTKVKEEMKELLAGQVRATLVALLGEEYANVKIPPLQLDSPKTPISEQRASCHGIEKQTPCLLAVRDASSGNLVMVAEGQTYPLSDNILHGQPIRVNHCKVSVLHTFPDYVDIDLSVPSRDDIEGKLGLAKGQFLMWLIEQVIFQDQTHQLAAIGDQTKNIHGNSAQSANKVVLESDGTSITPFDATTIDNLGEECQVLHTMILEMQNGGECDKVVYWKTPFMYYENDGQTVVTRTDIEELLQLACLNVSRIHVYRLFLATEYSSICDNTISFLCSYRTCGSEIKRNMNQAVAYVKHAFNVEANKGIRQSKFILALTMRMLIGTCLSLIFMPSKC